MVTKFCCLKNWKFMLFNFLSVFLDSDGVKSSCMVLLNSYCTETGRYSVHFLDRRVFM